MALRDVDSAFTRFFKKQGGYPKFHSKYQTRSMLNIQIIDTIINFKRSY